jgi:FAD/FMN-containing dehydrogenase
MGGQQFAAGAVHIDTRAMDSVVALDTQRGVVDAGAGIMWPVLIDALERMQPGDPEPWTIRQKQTGADRMTLGGSVSANIHGRGLAMAPLVSDIESLRIVDARGEEREVSRARDPRLFSLVVGGYGLFGIVTRVRLRLARRRVVRRDVRIVDSRELMSAFAERIGAGYLLGDWQFAIDPSRDDFMRTGVFSCYRPVETCPIPPDQRALTPEDWVALLGLAHSDKHRGFERYRDHYLRTDGQLYHSDRCQLAPYVDDYHRLLPAPHCRGTEMISELYVPRECMEEFLVDAARLLRAGAADLIYGTVRLVREDRESVLAWARGDWACTIFNLHTGHAHAELARTARAFRGLIDAAIALGGSYYLTYHRFATRRQVLACHPRLPEFLEAKREHDPRGIFQSEWHRHYAAMFARESAWRERDGRGGRGGRAAEGLARPRRAFGVAARSAAGVRVPPSGRAR